MYPILDTRVECKVIYLSSLFLSRIDWNITRLECKDEVVSDIRFTGTLEYNQIGM